MRLNGKKSFSKGLILLVSFVLSIFLFQYSYASIEKVYEMRVMNIANSIETQGDNREQSNFNEKVVPLITSQNTDMESSSSSGVSKPSSESQSNSGSSEFDEAVALAQALNLATVSICKIIETQDRIVLDMEYNNIINNLKFEKVSGKEKSIRDILNLYKEIMDKITEFKLSDKERERFLERFEKEKHRAFWKSAGGVRAYGATLGTFLLSLVQAGVSAYFNYRDFKADLEKELDEGLWKLDRDKVESINRLWTEWLTACWSISSAYNFDSKGLAVIRENSIKDYLRAEQERDINKSLVLYQDLERNNDFIQSYPPFWLSYAMKLDKAYAESKDNRYKDKREECLDKFFSVHRSILAIDPIYSKACILKMQSVYQRDPELKNGKTREELYRLAREAEKHIEDTDGMGRIFISAIYQKLGKVEDAEHVLNKNLVKGVDIEFSKQALGNLRSNKSVLNGIPQLAGLLIEVESDYEEDSGLSIEDLMRLAEEGKPVAMFMLGTKYALGLVVPRDYAKAREWYEKLAEKGDAWAMNKLGDMYYNGRGVPRDYTKAREWYEKSAEKGDALAMNNLGVLYGNGLGVPQDYVLAYAYYTIAMKIAEKESDNDLYSTAKSNRDNLFGWFFGITQEQVREAEEIVNSWKEGQLPRRLR